MSVVDCCFDLATMADDAGIRQQSLHVLLGEAHHFVDFKITEGGPEVLALGQNSAPAQTGLKAFQAQLLEQAPVVGYRETPLLVVIGEKQFRRIAAPTATKGVIGAQVKCHDRFAPSWVS